MFDCGHCCFRIRVIETAVNENPCISFAALIVLTFGLFYFVINAFLLWLTDKLIDGFEVKGLFNTLIAAFLISLIDALLRWIVPFV